MQSVDQILISPNKPFFSSTHDDGYPPPPPPLNNPFLKLCYGLQWKHCIKLVFAYFHPFHHPDFFFESNQKRMSNINFNNFYLFHKNQLIFSLFLLLSPPPKKNINKYTKSHSVRPCVRPSAYWPKDWKGPGGRRSPVQKSFYLSILNNFYHKRRWCQGLVTVRGRQSFLWTKLTWDRIRIESWSKKKLMVDCQEGRAQRALQFHPSNSSSHIKHMG